MHALASKRRPLLAAAAAAVACHLARCLGLSRTELAWGDCVHPIHPTPAHPLHCTPSQTHSQTLPGWDGADFSSLAWVRDPTAHRWRLFAGSLDGAVYEADFDRQQLLHASDSYGGAVWALAAAPRRGAAGGGSAGAQGAELVAACDDGSLRVLRVAPGAAGCEYVRSLAKVEGKALAVAWRPDGAALASGGSDGCVHVWDYATGRELLRITAAVRSSAPPCIWALAVLPDGTIVSGDSDGATQFWEGRFGTLVSRLQQHVADVMAVAASVDGSLVYSAGVDPRVRAGGCVSCLWVGVCRGGSRLFGRSLVWGL
jgi:U3 small nucleolar RNA-associated protein 4